MATNSPFTPTDADGDDFDGQTDLLQAGLVVTPGVAGYADPSGVFPSPGYFFRPSINKIATGDLPAGLDIGGGHPSLPNMPDVSSHPAGSYPNVDANLTASGHLVMIDDTPGAERVLIRHTNGSGVELRADGTMVMKAAGNMVTSVPGSSSIMIEGDITLVAANLTFDVAGDINIKSGGNFNVVTGGDLAQTIAGSSRQTVGGNEGKTVRGNASQTTVGSRTDTTLGGHFTAVKGSMSHVAQGVATYCAQGAVSVTSAAEVNMSSPSVNIVGDDLSVFGATGVVGGQGVHMYAASATVETHIQAETVAGNFHGDLKGKADKAKYSEVAALVSPGPPVNPSHTDANTTAREKPTADLVTSYLTQSSRGAPSVSIDPGGHIANSIDQTMSMGGVSSAPLTAGETRARMRNPANAANADFVANQIAAGSLSPSYNASIPPSVNRVRDNNAAYCRVPSQPIVGSSNIATSKSFKPAPKPLTDRFFVDAKYDVNKLQDVNGSTLLAAGIPLSTFFGGSGSGSTLASLPTAKQRVDMARQLTLQAQVASIIRLDNTGMFKSYRLVVVEGVYSHGVSETATVDSVSGAASRGEAIVYSLIGPNGRPAPDMMYEFADWMTDFVQFDKVILDYDTYAPDGSISAHLIVVMPKISRSYLSASGAFANKLETRFNNKVIAAGVLAEVQPK